MDAATALTFVRSRHAEGDEGTDLARDARQQKVIQAIKNKVLSKPVLTSPQKLLGIWEVMQASTETDLGDSQIAILGRKVFPARNSIKSYVLPQDLLINPPISTTYDKQYVFIPKSGNWNEVHAWVNELLPRS